MPMRENCKNFESRTYRNGDTVRKCNLDLAPEAPWRCPEDCPAFEARLADVNWKYGTLVTPPTPPAPESIGTDDSIGALLDEAEEIVNSAGPKIKAELEAERPARRFNPGGRLSGLTSWFRRRKGD
jgi:hypothetical protein